MLFVVSYRPQPSISEQSQRRGLQIFSQWQPPAGFFKAHYATVDGGGFAVVETDSAAQLVEATARFTAYLEFKVTPVVDIMEAVPLFMKADAWVQSLG